MERKEYVKLNFLEEFQFRINKCKTEDSFEKTLEWGITEYESLSLPDPVVKSFSDPVAAMVIETFIHCPGAVERCARKQEKVARSYKQMFGEYDLLA